MTATAPAPGEGVVLDAEPTLTINLDGRAVPAKPGEFVIAAAERAGVFIPRFCYHPRMRSVGMCRMCLVEITGPRGPSLQPACFITVADGQEISTTSPAVVKAQDGVLEFLLVNHPLDCPVCDKGGECPLQDQTLAYGPGESRFIEDKRHFEKPIPISELVLLDRERCIQCARCTRFADEIAGEALIDFFGRGDKVEVGIFASQPFSSYFSGNTVQICPVGALTAVPYRFKSRPWDLEQAESTCTTCSVGCRVAVQSSTGRVVRYLGIDVDAVNQGWLCDKGRFGFEWLNGDDRLSAPMLREEGGELAPVGWSRALTRVAEDVKDAVAAHGTETIAVIGGARLANEDAYAWAKLAKAVIGTDSVDAQLGDGLPAELALGLPRATIDETCDAKAILTLAPDLREELPVLFLRLRLAAINAKLPIVELSTMPTALTPNTAASLSYRPGELAFAVRPLTAALSGSGTGDDESAARARRRSGRPTAAGEGDAGGGVNPDDLERAVEALRAALDSPSGEGLVIVVGRPSVAESEQGVADAVHLLAAALPGARFLPLLRRGNAQGALDMGLAPGILPGRVSLDEGRAWYESEAAWGKTPRARGRDTAEILAAANRGEIDVLFLVGADPIADFPDRDLARRGLAGARTIVSVDTLMSESTGLADVVLPAAAYSERGGTTTNLEGRVTRLAQKVAPPGVAWADWVIAAEIASLLGTDLGFSDLDSIWDEIERVAPSHRGLTTTALAAPDARDGVVVPLPETPVAQGGIGRRGALSHMAVPLIDPIAIPGIESVWKQGSASQSGSVMYHGHKWIEIVAGSDEGDDGSEAAAEAEAEAGAAPDDTAGEALTDSAAVASGGGADSAAGGNETDSTAAVAPAVGRPPLIKFAAAAVNPVAPPVDAYALRLLTRRSLYDQGTQVQACPNLAGLAPDSVAGAHPVELDKLGINAGDQIRLRSSKSSLVVRIDRDWSVPLGVVAVGLNLQPDDDGNSAVDLIDSSAPAVNVRMETI
jgi:NADH-quinone oxidoreductase subunit G